MIEGLPGLGKLHDSTFLISLHRGSPCQDGKVSLSAYSS